MAEENVLGFQVPVDNVFANHRLNRIGCKKRKERCAFFFAIVALLCTLLLCTMVDGKLILKVSYR